MEKFCPKCGKIISGGVFCKDCAPNDIHFKEIKIKLCPSKKYFFHGKWHNFDDLRTLSNKLVKHIDIKLKLIKGLEENEDLLEKTGLKKTFEFVVEKANNYYNVPVNVEVTYSPAMAKAGSKYFEGILQVRNARDEVKIYIRNYIQKGNIIINKLVEKDDYVDLFFIDKKQMGPLALKLMRNFGGHIENSAQLFSHNKQTSKDIFRVNELVTIPKFKLGDCVVVDEQLVFITGLNKIITGINLRLNKKTTFVFDYKKDYEILEKKKTSVSLERPRTEILSPDTYQSEPAKNPFKVNIVQGQNIFVVKYKKIFYIIR